MEFIGDYRILERIETGEFYTVDKAEAEDGSAVAVILLQVIEDETESASNLLYTIIQDLAVKFPYLIVPIGYSVADCPEGRYPYVVCEYNDVGGIFKRIDEKAAEAFNDNTEQEQYEEEPYDEEDPEESESGSVGNVGKKAIIPVFCLILVIVGFFGWSFYRKYDASMTINKTLAEVQKIADNHEYASAITQIDELIKHYERMGEKFIGPANELRVRLVEKQKAWDAQQRKVKKAAALALERKQRIQKCVDEALRLCNDPKSLTDAEKLIAEAEKLVHSELEKVEVSKAKRTVDMARYKLCPKLALADFKVAWPLNNKFNGTAVAGKLTQALDGKFSFISRLATIKTLTDLNYEFKDLDDTVKLVKFGKKADADYVIIGSLFQEKRGIVLACQRISVKTGLVIQSAEIRGISLNNLNENIDQAAKIILMTDDQKRQYLEKTAKYTNYLSRAAAAQRAGRFDDAVEYYRKAIALRKTAGIVAKLTRVEELAENARIKAEKQAEIQHKVDSAKAAYLNTAREPDCKPVPDKAWTVPGLNMSFEYVHPGSFTMGDSKNKDGNIEHKVKLSKGYWLGKCEVSQMEYMLVMGNNPSQFKGFNLPVDNVCWNDAVAFCKKLNERERGAKRLPKGYEYRLPTEAEWEFAARGGLKSKGYKYVGGNDAVKVGWNDKNSGGKTHPVGTREPNELGLYNMAGNVIEACYDQYASLDNVSYTDPVIINSSAQIVRRGGAWQMSEVAAEVSYRYYNRRARKRNWFGFRVALAKKTALEAVKDAYLNTAREPDCKPVPGKVWTVPGLKMSFEYVRPGSFTMGDNNNKMGNIEHKVKLTKGYWLGKCEVSQVEYTVVMGTNPSLFKGFDLPVDNVSWEEGMTFCRKLNERERAAKRLPKGYEYRLPTEAEWEFAARGGVKSKGYKYIGGNNGVKVGWNDKNSGRKTHPVGTGVPNELGFYNMAGNLIEACYDQFGKLNNTPVTDPVIINSAPRIVRRGGCWQMSEAEADVSYRHFNRRNRKRNWFGFRVALAREIAQMTVKPEAGKLWTVPEIGMQMVYVEPGTFSMGSGLGRRCKPAHKVTLTKGYWIGKYEVTQAQYEALTGTNPSCFKGENNPVEMINWKEAVRYCQKLTQREQKSGRLPIGYEYRLPTEAEWEFAAIGGNQSRRKYKYSGGDRLDQVAWCKDSAGETTHPVGKKWGNELGLFDMTGNVYEMCFDSRYNYTTKAQTDPCFYFGGRLFIVRGGGWRNNEKNFTLYSRYGANRKKRHPDRGFRIVMGPKR